MSIITSYMSRDIYAICNGNNASNTHVNFVNADSETPVTSSDFSEF